MKKLSFFVAAALLAAACSPQVFPLYLEVRQPSASGLDLSHKSFSIAYMEGKDSLFDRSAASAMARKLEEDYFGGEEVVGLYKVPAADSVTLELMHSLVMETEGDVVFLLSTQLGEPGPETNQAVSGARSLDSAYVCPVAVPVVTHLDLYDSMGEDKLIPFKGSTVLRPLVYNNGVVTDEGLKTLARQAMAVNESEEVGRRMTRRFLSQWKTESFSFYYFDSFQADVWLEALQYMNEGQFAKAVDIWKELTQRGNAQKRACASYNIAMAFYLMEDYEMSSRWLSYAAKLENLSLAPGLAKRLAARLEKK